MRKSRSRITRALSPLARPAGLATTALVAIAGTIAVNAIYGQGARHPAPLFATRSLPGGIAAVPVPRAAPRSDREVLPETTTISAPAAEAGGGDVIVAAVQAGLSGAGYYDGPLDGLEGPRTEQAVLRFQREHGLPQTGAATADLLAALEQGSADTGPDLAPAADPEVLRVQRALADAAYGPLAVDGMVGEETRTAIRRFQAEHDMAVTGEIDEALVRRLKDVGALGSL